MPASKEILKKKKSDGGTLIELPMVKDGATGETKLSNNVLYPKV